MLTKVLQLVPVGNPPPGLMKALEEPLLAQRGVTAIQSKTQLTGPTYAFNKDRNQYHSNAIMRRLVPLIEPMQKFVMGVVDVDLFVPDSAFVFGEADREARVALLSIFRLRQGVDDKALLRRTQVEAVHQAGHLVGLSYCEDPRCVMFLASTPAEVDRKGVALCNLCRNEHTKLSR
jgi:archaemetzincin